jgi:hypothetical protein
MLVIVQNKQMRKQLLVALLTVLGTIGSYAAVIGFDQPSVGQIVTGTTFDNGWKAELNGDSNPEGSGANIYWYGSPPSGPNEVFEPDPALIRLGIRTGGNPDPTYHGGAAWLDSTATFNGGIFTRGPGVSIEKTISDVAGQNYVLGFYLNTEVTQPGIPPDNLKGSPAGVILSINGSKIDSGLLLGDFLSTGQPPIFSGPSVPADTDWTKYLVKFTGSGSDTIRFEDDISLLGALDGLTNGLFSSNTVLANITIVPETGMLTMVGLAGVIGVIALRRRQKQLV